MTTNDDRSSSDLSDEASRLLKSPALTAAFAALEERLYQRFLATPAHDVAALTEIKSCQDGLSAFRSELQAMLNDKPISEFNHSRSRLRKGFTK